MLLLYLFASTLPTLQTNLIQNGDFQTIGLPFLENHWNDNCPPQWTCLNTQHIGANFMTYILFGRYLDMWNGVGIGSLSQTVSIPQNGTCLLQYYLASYGPVQNCILNIWNNEILLDTKFNPSCLTNINQSYESLSFNVSSGPNTIKFTEGAVNACYGSLIDNISFTCTYFPVDISITNSTENATGTVNNTGATNATGTVNTTGATNPFSPSTIIALASCLSFSLSSIQILRQPLFLLADLWLYSYNLKNYTGLILIVFDTITEMENLKFQVVSKLVGIYNYKPQLPISNYQNFTSQKFYEKEGASSVLIDCQLSFFLFSFPQTVLQFVLLYLLKRLTRKNCIGAKLSKFKFIKTNIIQITCEQNLAYFVFICFNSFNHLFSFKFMDKIASAITLVFLLFLLQYTLTFCSFVYKYVTRKPYFLEEELKENLAGRLFCTVKWCLRSFLRGVVFSLYRIYQAQMSLLATIELVLLITTVALQCKHRIFKSKVSLIYTVLYHTLHLALNIIFLLSDIWENSQKQLASQAIQAQEIVIYSLAGVTILFFVIEIIILIQLPYCIRKRRIQPSTDQFQRKKQKIRIQAPPIQPVLIVKDKNRLKQKQKKQKKQKIQNKYKQKQEQNKKNNNKIYNSHRFRKQRKKGNVFQPNQKFIEMQTIVVQEVQDI